MNYQFMAGMRRAGKTHAKIQVFKLMLLDDPRLKLLVPNLKYLDYAISQGI